MEKEKRDKLIKLIKEYGEKNRKLGEALIEAIPGEYMKALDEEDKVYTDLLKMIYNEL